MSDVAIIGIGIHPFGRSDGVSGLEQGAFAVRQALKDCVRSMRSACSCAARVVRVRSPTIPRWATRTSTARRVSRAARSSPAEARHRRAAAGATVQTAFWP